MMKIITILMCVCLMFSCKNINDFSAGSYPYAETYTIRSPEEEVIERINKLKEDNIDFVVPKFQWKGKEIELIDERKSHWYVFDFYLKDKDQIIHFWTRSVVTDPKLTKVALVGVRDGVGLGNWKTINKDLSEEEDKEIKKIFEDRILSKIE